LNERPANTVYPNTMKTSSTRPANISVEQAYQSGKRDARKNCYSIFHRQPSGFIDITNGHDWLDRNQPERWSQAARAAYIDGYHDALGVASSEDW